MQDIAQGESRRVKLLFRGPDVASLLLRAMIGVVFIAHGAQKLFGAFGGGGLDAAAKVMAGFGLKPGMFFAVLGGISEFGGGLLLFVGLLTPLAGLIIAGDGRLSLDRQLGFAQALAGRVHRLRTKK